MSATVSVIGRHNGSNAVVNISKGLRFAIESRQNITRAQTLVAGAPAFLKYFTDPVPELHCPFLPRRSLMSAETVRDGPRLHGRLQIQVFVCPSFLEST